jgi:peptidoglycan/LPS O-acetylase OafA/YrhL
MFMKYRTYLIYASILALSYNFLILISVALNQGWVRTRAAGGQYETFPITIRVIYFLMAIFMATLMFWLWDHRNRSLNSQSKRLARILGYTFIVSTFLQIISQSPDERWNAIPAIVLAVTFLMMGIKNKLKSGD